MTHNTVIPSPNGKKIERNVTNSDRNKEKNE